MTRTLSGYYGLYRLSDHALGRIAQRFETEGEAEALLWVIAQMSRAERLTCLTWERYTNAPRIIWQCPDGVRIITDGNDVITAFAEGEPDHEEGSEEVA